MALKEFSEKGRVLYQLNLITRIDDINYGQHVAATAVPKFLQQARVKFLQALSFSEKDIGGVGIILTDLHVRYLCESFFDEELLIELTIETITKTSAIFVYYLTNQTRNKPFAKSEERIVFFDYTRRKVARVPEVFINAILELNERKYL